MNIESAKALADIKAWFSEHHTTRKTLKAVVYLAISTIIADLANDPRYIGLAALFPVVTNFISHDPIAYVTGKKVKKK